MYHFVSEQTAELRLSENVLIPSQTTQYLKCFQLEAVRFLFERLSKQEFCIFNDESGLGKCSAVVALLSGLGAAKKSLIVLQNDDQLLAGWQFHLGILTDLPVCVLKDVNDSTESSHSVYLSKWSVLRSIGDLSKLNFDYVIVDHRGHTLNNNFCTSMLLKQYERKVNIVISSVDITSDVKLLYNVLRLGGCLEHQHKCFRSFERKFHLPDVKEVLSKRVDLEEYYKQRGALGDYIKEFRLRRYRHQFDSYIPLVTPDQYKTNLSLWLGQNNSNSTLSGSTIESSSEVRSTAGTDEIFEGLMSIRGESEFAQRSDSEKRSLSEHGDDVVAMEPLVFEMSESEVEEVMTTPAKASSTDIVLLSSDDCEIVTPPNTPPHMAQLPTTAPTARSKRKQAKRAHAARADLSESETEDQPTFSRRTTKKLNVRLSRISLQKHDEVANANNFKKPLNQLTKPETVAPTEKPKQTKSLRAKVSRPTKLATEEPVESTAEPKTPKVGKASSITPKTEPRPKRSNGSNISNEVQPRVTRGMQRMTRSADSRPHSKYMAPMVALGSTKRKRNWEANQTPRSSKRIKQEEVVAQQEVVVTPKKPKSTPAKIEPIVKKPRGRPPKKISSPKPPTMPSNKEKEISPKTKITAPTATPELLSSSSGSILSNSSYLQCAQKLPENLAELASMELPEFRVPHAPQATPLMLPISLNFFSDSEVVVVPSPNPQPDIVMINSSHDESSEQSAKQSQSRRTRALKSKRAVPAKEPPKEPSTSSFGQLLAQQRGMVNKSPDIFSNCSDMSQLTLAQPVPFEGFKIFGSEVKQLQQQHAKTQSGMLAKKKRERSCLDILENMFDPHKSKNIEPSVQLLPNLPSPKQQTPQRRFTLLDDDIFEITNNGEFGSRLRLTASGNVSPVQQQQRNKITNYLISSGNTPDDPVQRTQFSQALRKSPKAAKSTQSTKLTRWFGAAATAAHLPGESQSAPSTPVVPVEKVARARSARSGRAGKRKRLELNK